MTATTVVQERSWSSKTFMAMCETMVASASSATYCSICAELLTLLASDESRDWLLHEAGLMAGLAQKRCAEAMALIGGAGDVA
jgi:hypothetical protein